MVFRIILFLLLFPIHHVLGQLILTDSEKSFTPNSSLEILKSDREIGAHQILALRDSFIRNEDPYPNLGLSKYSVWTRFTIKNASQANHYLLDLAYPLLDEVELYERDSLEGLISIH
jgi:hypothetical protein